MLLLSLRLSSTVKGLVCCQLLHPDQVSFAMNRKVTVCASWFCFSRLEIGTYCGQSAIRLAATRRAKVVWEAESCTVAMAGQQIDAGTLGEDLNIGHVDGFPKIP